MATVSSSTESSYYKSNPHVPKRYIFTPEDLDQFLESSAKRSLSNFANALGRACAEAERYEYDPAAPLKGLSPGLASLHGSLGRMAEDWIKEIPPETHRGVRFGNPAFRTWHERIVRRSRSIVRSMLECHRTHGDVVDEDEVLERCRQRGDRAASKDDGDDRHDDDDSSTIAVVTELSHYLRASFGHPVRLDYGTGHESSFLVFLLAFTRATGSPSSPEDAHALAPIALSVFAAYLRVTRGLQTLYVLEPAGSHGVWGLDDYHCLPFFFGARQMSRPDNDVRPSAVRDRASLEELSDSKMYFGCVRYVTELKKGVPFFESSPMLNDISHLPSWDKVSKGLVKLYEGEVLSKLPVVQHFTFGALFPASWTPSRPGPKTAPKRTFLPPDTVAPWVGKVENEEGARVGVANVPLSSLRPAPSPPTHDTRAPWAK